MKRILTIVVVLIAGITIYYNTPLSEEDIDFAKCFPEGMTLVTLGSPAKTLWDQQLYTYHTDNRLRVQWYLDDCGAISINGKEKFGHGSQPDDLVSSLQFTFYQDRLTVDEVQKAVYEFLPEGTTFGAWREYRGDRDETVWTASCLSSTDPCYIVIRERDGLEWGTSSFVLEINIDE